MAINFDIKDANHLVNSQLAATTLNDEINNVIKFYRAMITYLSPLYPGSANITDGIGQDTLNGIIGDSLNQINNLTANRGIQIVNKAVGHSSTTTGVKVAGLTSNNSKAYSVNINIPYIILDDYGHIANMQNRYITIPYPSILPVLVFSGSETIGANYKTVSLTEQINPNYIYAITFAGYETFISGYSIFFNTKGYTQIPLTTNWGLQIAIDESYASKIKIKRVGGTQNLTLLSINRYFRVI